MQIYPQSIFNNGEFLYTSLKFSSKTDCFRHYLWLINCNYEDCNLYQLEMGRCKVHIICQKKEIRSLLMKALDEANYVVSFSEGDFIRDFFKDVDDGLDCIIINGNLNTDLYQIIRKRFGDIPVICLPSFNGEHIGMTNVKYISEPLKISELKTVLEEIKSSGRILH